MACGEGLLLVSSRWLRADLIQAESVLALALSLRGAMEALGHRVDFGARLIEPSMVFRCAACGLEGVIDTRWQPEGLRLRGAALALTCRPVAVP